MKVLLAANVLVAALGAGPNFALADEQACPIAGVVARVQSVVGDAEKAKIKRAPNGDAVLATLARAFFTAIALKLALKQS